MKAELVELDATWQVISTEARHGNKTGTGTHTHTHIHITLTWVSNDEVNFTKQQIRESGGCHLSVGTCIIHAVSGHVGEVTGV